MSNGNGRRDISATVNLEAEESLLGAMLLSIDGVEVGLATLVAADFHGHGNAEVFAAIDTLYRAGEPIDPISVVNQLDRDGTADRVGKNNGGRGAKYRVLTLQGGCPASANASAYARMMIDAADRRRLLNLGEQIMRSAADPTAPIDDVADQAQASITELLRPTMTDRHPSFADWSADVTMDFDWVMPQVIERRDRIILVAQEGIGKSFLLRQWALMAAAGVHWFKESPCPPCTALVVDVENSARQIVRATAAMHEMACRVAPNYDHERFTIIPFRGGLDLNRRADRLRVEAYLAGHRPDVLVIGPLYKLFSSSSSMTYEENATRASDVIDRWRDRYGCAVLIEHHAAKGSGGKRDLDPLGSSVWMRWPEFGLRLDIDPKSPQAVSLDVTLGHFRGQREWRAWPKTLERGRPGQWGWRSSQADREDF